MAQSRVQLMNCGFDNHALRPGACPLPKHPVLFNAVLNTRCKASFCLLLISRKKERELIKTMHIFVKDLEEILASRVPTFTVSARSTMGLLSHFSTYRERR